MPPEATWVIAGARSGPSAATAMIEATTMLTGITSTVPSGTPWELVEQAAGVGDQDRLGHAEPADPAGLGFGERRLDDRRRHHRHRDRTLDVGQRLLAERLRERVGIGPADARRTGSPGVHEFVLHPSIAERLRLRRQCGCTGRWSSSVGSARNRSRFSRLRLAASASERIRRLAATSLRQSMPTSNGPSLTNCSGALPRRLPATYRSRRPPGGV